MRQRAAVADGFQGFPYRLLNQPFRFAGADHVIDKVAGVVVKFVTVCDVFEAFSGIYGFFEVEFPRAA